MSARTIKRTNSSDHDFISLISQLDRYLHSLYGAGMSYYQPLNVIENCDTVVVVYVDGVPAGCGCLRKFSEDTVEVKRMFVPEAFRKQGIATAVLHELEQWAGELQYKHILLETGDLLADAIRLYQKNNYNETEKWGPYVGMATSICLKKTISK